MSIRAYESINMKLCETKKFCISFMSLVENEQKIDNMLKLFQYREKLLKNICNSEHQFRSIHTFRWSDFSVCVQKATFYILHIAEVMRSINFYKIFRESWFWSFYSSLLHMWENNMYIINIKQSQINAFRRSIMRWPDTPLTLWHSM